MADYMPVTSAIERHYSSSVAQVRADARYVTRWQVPRPPATRGRAVSIDVPPELAKVAAEIMNAAAPAVSRAYNKEVRPVGTRAFHGWPERTGFQKSSLKLGYELADGGNTYRAVFTVDSQTPKAAYMVRFAKPEVRRSGYYGKLRQHTPLPPGAKPGENVYRFLLYRPLHEAAMRIADEIARGI